MKIHFSRGGRKYILDRDYLHRRIPGFEQYSHIRDGDFHLSMGALRVFAGFSWDGASGPAIDGPSNMRASLVHDVLYILIRRMKFSKRKHWERLRKAADKEFHRILREDGMGWFRAWYYYRAVRWFGEDALLGRYRAKAKEIAAKVIAPSMVR